MIGKGTQAALDMFRCLEDVICDKEKIKNILEDAAAGAGMKELALYAADNEEADDYCFIMLCANGHIFLHVFPSYGYVGADIFTLEDSLKSEQIATFLRGEFGPDQSKVTTILRGDSELKDMKPRRKKNVKTLRKAKNAGAKLKKMVLKKKEKQEDES